MGIEGNVYWIDGKRQTTKTVSAKEAFSDPEQAAAQVLYYEKHGSAEENGSLVWRIVSIKANAIENRNA